MSFHLLPLRLASALPLLALALLEPAPPSSPAAIPEPNTFATPLSIDRGPAALVQDLRRLSTRASLLTIVAHPDDEDGGMLTYTSRHTGADTSMLTLTRGEGGQNLMSADFWDQLGEVRTQELLAADRFYGVHQYFASLADFGFSKTLAESLKLWGHDRTLYDCVRVVRLTRPLVVNATFAGNVSDGHGQHQVSGLMAQEVYKLAGDPTVFPDQIQAGLLPWSPLKVYARVPFARVSDRGIYDYATGHTEPVRFQNYVTGAVMTAIPSTTLEVPEGTYEPLFGRSFLAVAREGLDQQKSQNGGTVPQPGPGPSPSPYHLYASRLPGPLPTAEQDFFEGIDTSITGISTLAPVAERAAWHTRLQPLQDTVAEATRTLDPEHPDRIAPVLARALGQTLAVLTELDQSTLPADSRYNLRHELSLKRDQCNQALVDALGLSLQAAVTPTSAFNASTPTAPVATPGESLSIALRVANQGSLPVHLDAATLTSPAGGSWQIVPATPSPTSDLAPASSRDFLFRTTVPADVPITEPYFSRPTLEQAFYDLRDPQYRNLPEMPYPLAGTVHLTYAGQPLTLQATVQSLQTQTTPATPSAPAASPALYPLLTAPALSIGISPRAGILPLSSHTLRVEVTVQTNQPTPASGTVQLDLPPSWTASPASARFATAQPGQHQVLHFDVTPAHVQSRPYTITAVASTASGQRFSEDIQTVGYPGLRPYPYAQPATFRTTGTDVRVAPGLRVAYIMGTGDAIPASLLDLGIHVTTLSPAALAAADLARFDTIVLGIRTFAAHPELATANPRLLAFVHQGGTLIVQYQLTNFPASLAPYPLTLSADPEKVVEEDSAVALQPNDPLLSWPNRITSADFSGWVEERGHGFLRSWDPHFVTPTEMHDAGQDPQRGGLAYARYGRGTYIYLAFAFFREMPEGVPGSFRLMANLLSAGKNPALATSTP